MKCRLPSLLDDVRVARAGVVCDVLVACRAAIESNIKAGSQEVRSQSAYQAFACLHSHQLCPSAEQEPAYVRIALHHPHLRGPAKQHQGGGLCEPGAPDLRYCNLNRSSVSIPSHVFVTITHYFRS